MKKDLHLTLQDQYFQSIISGLKTVEGRVKSSKFNDIYVGMDIVFSSVSTGQTIKCHIKKINYYHNFYVMLTSEGISNMLPGIYDIDQAVAVYENFPCYKEKVLIHGAIAIHFKIL